MKLYIKNMVCSRCKMAVKTALEKTGLHPQTIDLGEIELEKPPTPAQLEELGLSLGQLGFELIDDKKSRIIAQIKTLIIKWVHHSGEPLAENLSGYLAARLHYEYTYLSTLFSDVEGTPSKNFLSHKKSNAPKNSWFTTSSRSRKSPINWDTAVSRTCPPNSKKIPVSPPATTKR